MLFEGDIPRDLDGEARLLFVLKELRLDEPAYSRARAAAERILQPFKAAHDRAKTAEQAVLSALPACVEALPRESVRELTEPAITGTFCAARSDLGQLLAACPERPGGGMRWVDHEYMMPPPWRMIDRAAGEAWLEPWLAALTPEEFGVKWRKDGEPSHARVISTSLYHRGMH